jgi:hypothetical protein
MVCASTEKAGRIAGGFVLLNVAGLMTAWRACQARPLGIGDFRTWLACHELVTRRCRIHETRDRSPSYRVAELAKLLKVTEKRARASLRRLVEAGLIEWSDSAIGLLDPRDDQAEGLDDTIGRGRGSVAIPRQMLRYLAYGAAPALIATALGLLLRCLSRRKDGFDGRGRVKASWIARKFGVNLRQVKAARRQLLDLGWIEAEPGDQWAENRWGRAFRIDLGWRAPASGGKAGCIPPFPGATSAPLRAIPGPSSAPPDLHQEPLTESNTNQDLGQGPSGFSKGPGKEDKLLTAHTNSVPAGMKPVSAIAAPKLADVRLEDLKETGRLLDLYRQTVARGLVGTSEADRLRFVGAAEHALAIASNPAALMVWLVLNGCWRYITGADEDRARQRLRLHDFGPPRGSTPAPILASSAARPPGVFAAKIPSPSRPIESGGLSEDARVVKAIREATIQAGIFRDPWPAFQARYAAWDRSRWDRAMGELGLM